MKRIAAPSSHAGLSLIELMVAITLGLMITTSLGYILMGSRSTYRTQDASARVQDTGRFALEFIGRQIRVAGRTDITPLASDGRVELGVDIEPITTKNTLDSSGNITKKRSTATELIVQYQLTDLNGQAIQDCNGFGVTPPVDANKIVNVNGTVLGHYATVFNTISRDVSMQLQCLGNGGATQPFAEEVEELQFRYTTGNGTWAATPTAPVRAVEVCIRVRSSANGVVNTTQTIRDCAGNNFTPNPADTRLRRTFTSVFALRNSIHAVP
ncbi:MAG: PilW family protein [Gallionellaceae bacterium]|nr:PilW family protein [Gallionellaceae bacterium]